MTPAAVMTLTDAELDAALDAIRVEAPEPPPLLHEMDAPMTPLLHEMDAPMTPDVAKLVRQAMAAWHMAYLEPDRDELDAAEADRISASWFAHWMKGNHPTAHEDEEHFGDCTGHSISCMRCIADEAFRSVDAALAALRGIGGEA